jgi:hypothetical protein
LQTDLFAYNIEFFELRFMGVVLAKPWGGRWVQPFGYAQDRGSGFSPSATLRTGVQGSALRLRSGQGFRVQPFGYAQDRGLGFRF